MVKNITRPVSKHKPGESVYEQYLHTNELLSDFRAVLDHEHVSLVDVYIHADQHPLLMACAEALIDYDEVFQLFRAQHLKLAQRMIGPGSIGTGGTSMEMLERTLRDVFYPELWEVRNRLTQIANEQGEL